MNLLLISLRDIVQLTTLSGNLDSDQINPSINLAQVTDLKRILGVPLYEKILADKAAGTLTGIYKELYEDHIVILLVYLTCARYMAFGGYRTANNGIFKISSEGQPSVDHKEVTQLIARYSGDAASMERELVKFLKANPVPEYSSGENQTKSKGRLINWY